MSNAPSCSWRVGPGPEAQAPHKPERRCADERLLMSGIAHGVIPVFLDDQPFGGGGPLGDFMGVGNGYHDVRIAVEDEDLADLGQIVFEVEFPF